MSPGTAAPRDTAVPRVDGFTLTAVGGLSLVTLVMVFVGNGNVALALTPLALVLVVFAALKAPLRRSLLVLGFLALTLENPNEAPAAGFWRSPLYTVGALMLSKLNLTLPVPALVFTGLDLALAVLVMIWVWRRMTGSNIDVAGHVPPASPLRAAGQLCFVTVFLIWGSGMLRAGFSFDNSLWQVFRVIYLPTVFLLFCAGLRGPADAPALGAGLVASALLRAGMAIYVRFRFPDKELVPHATTHFDSMLFAAAFLLVVTRYVEAPRRKNLALALAVAPILSWAMVANNRRIAWVELIAGLLLVYLISPWTRLKRGFARGVVIALPVIAIYTAVGWNARSGLFAPVRTLRSVVDSQADPSTLWRDIENYNLFYTLRGNPVFGTGFGHGYIEVVRLPDISSGYAIYRYAPHNSVLGLLAYGGMTGFFGLWLLFPLGIFFAVRSYRFSTAPGDRVAAITCIGVLLAFLIHCYGDMALGSWTSVFTVAPALALVAKQAVATGAWPPPRRTTQ
jgi:hypothetical protein